MRRVTHLRNDFLHCIPPALFGRRPAAESTQGLSPSQLARAKRFGRRPKAARSTVSVTAMGIVMGQSFGASQWKDRDSTRKDSTDQGLLPLIGEVPALSLAEDEFIGRCSWEGALRYSVQRSGRDDFEIADEVGISHSYMSKVLKGTAGLYGPRLIKFMRRTGCAAPGQWINHQIGAEMVMRNRQAARIAELTAELQRLTGKAA